MHKPAYRHPPSSLAMPRNARPRELLMNSRLCERGSIQSSRKVVEHTAERLDLTIEILRFTIFS